MADKKAYAERVERLRSIMRERGYDAVILRNNPDLRWLTGAERTFDDEVAHTALVTADHLFLHTDSRYYNTFIERLGTDTAWEIDQDIVDPADWAAEHVRDAHARVVAVEDTATLAFYDAFEASLVPSWRTTCSPTAATACRSARSSRAAPTAPTRTPSRARARSSAAT